MTRNPRARRPALLRSVVPLLAAAVLLASCASYRLLREAEQAEAREDWDEAVAHYLELADSDPGNVRWRSALLRARIRAAQEHFAAGRRFQDAGVLERALVELQRAVQLDPSNQYAEVELNKLRARIESERRAAGPPPTLEELKARARDQPAQPPMLSPRSDSPISLDFPQPQSLFAIYQALGKAFGINVLFDPQLRDQEMAIELRNVTAQTALETLMRAAGHFYKVIDEQTILIAQDTQQNRRTYEDLVIQTFYLSNAEVKDAVQLLRALISSRNLATNEQLNAVTIRDTADKVRIAQRIIETVDKSRSEVVVDIELIEIDSAKVRELGVSLSSYSVTQSLDLGEDVPVRLPDLRHLTQNSWTLTIPSIIYDFLKSDTDFQLLAKPQVRITDGEKAKVRLGDQVPVPVTTFNSSNTVGGNIVPITSFQYKEVGINIDLEPRVHHNKEVTLKLQVEVSQVTGEVDAGGGQVQPIIGQRVIESTIRLKDGETNFLAGLIRTDETHGDVGVPGLSDIPVLGKLFSKNSTDVRRTDIMLTLTPHIIRAADITQEDLMPIWVGTESNMTFRGGSPRLESRSEGPFDEAPAVDEEAAEEQRRLERLQRQQEQLEEQGAEPGEPEAAPPVDLVPATPPVDPFGAGESSEEGAEDEEPPGARAAAAASLVPLELVRGTRASGPTGPGVRLDLQPSVVSVETGERFQVALEVDARVPVSHLPATLTYDPSRLAVERVEAGDYLGGSEASEVLADTSTPGTIVLGASRLGRRAGVAGRGTVATIHFRSLAPGASPVTISDRRVLDPGLMEIAGVETAGAAIDVRPLGGLASP